MDWNDLRYVLAIARAKTLVQAAEVLGVAHTTVGRRLRTLEGELGVRLFDRTPEGFVATAAGEDLRAVAERMEGDVLAAEGRMLGRDAQLRGKLSVATVDVFFHVFEQAFISFMRRYPSVELSLSMSSERVSLSRREADVVLRLSNGPPETLVGRRLGPVQFGVYASAELIEAVGRGAPLAAFPWIGWEGGPHLRWFEGWLEENAPGAKIALRMDYQGMSVAHAVSAGIGAQLLPCFLADPDPKLERIAALDESFRLELWLLTLAELRGNSRIHAFMEHMAEAMGAHRSVLKGEGAWIGARGASR